MKIKKVYQGNLPDNKIVNAQSYSQTDTYSCSYLNNKLNPWPYDGTGIFGWYSTASSGENLTANYDVSVNDMYNLTVGSKWEWPSRVQSGAYNTGMPYYSTSYSARTSNWDLYYVKAVSMNGSYYEYAYDSSTVYKEYYPDEGGIVCLSGDTKVWTPNGAKLIKDIKENDKVLSYDWRFDKVDYYEVSLINSHPETEMIKIILENDNYLLATKNHPFWEETYGKIPAGTIKIGMKLVNSNGQVLTVKNIEKINKSDMVYDLHMGKYIRNYYIGEDKIMVFNEPEYNNL